LSDRRAGAWLLARDLLRSRAAAVFAGIVFAFSGLFAETSSHVGPFQATSLLPWLLWTGLARGAFRAMASGGRDRVRLPGAGGPLSNGALLVRRAGGMARLGIDQRFR